LTTLYGRKKYGRWCRIIVDGGDNRTPLKGKRGVKMVKWGEKE